MKVDVTKMLPVVVLGLIMGQPTTITAQVEVLERGSQNMEVLGHTPLGPRLSISDMDVEQELHRPYA